MMRWIGVVTAVAIALGPEVALGEESADREQRPLRTEWIVDGALAAVWLGLIPAMVREPDPDALFGPSFRSPEDVAILDAGIIGRPLGEEETITDGELMAAIAGGLGGALLLGGLAPLIDADHDQGRRWWAEQALATMIGMIQTVWGTYALTETVKNSVGRLRPDFADRADRYYCHQEPIPELYRSRCSSLEARGELGPAVDAEVVTRGRRSFWSGHSSLSAAAMTYGALIIGGRMVWGRGATAITRTIGILSQGAAVAAALFIAQSRISDGVHHPEDVWVGTAVGFAMAQLSYWLHFDGHGEVRRNISLQAAPTQGGLTAAVFGRF